MNMKMYDPPKSHYNIFEEDYESLYQEGFIA
ncbi:MAG: hypothetical protein ACI9Y7_001561 [Dokdonia sp.]|jgi:hypothetical protein